MGAAMAGMLVPRLNVLPDGVWVAVFGMGAAWFGWRAVRARGLRASSHSPVRLPVPHLIECVAMLYMLLPLHGSRLGHGGMAMAGMGASATPAGGFPALAAVLALFMVGYIVWTTDRLASLARARATPPPVLEAAAPPPSAAGAASTRDGAGTRRGNQAGRPVLAPTLAVCGKLVMSITMGYMLILML
jgi:hypothetical protein